MADAPRIAAVGVLPPPVHGAAWVNRQVCDRLAAAGLAVLEIDLAPPPGATGLRAKLSRPWRVLRGLARLLKQPGRIAALDLSLAGGSGRWLDLPFLLLARIAGWRVVVHHHSFAYVDRPDAAGRWMARLAGPRATHIALCGCMGERLAAAYPWLGPVLAISNAAHLAGDPRPARTLPRDRPFTIGFLGNITRDKGIFDAFDLGDRLRDAGIRLTVAGPLAEPSIAAEVAARGSGHTLVGPVYGPAKTAFLDGIDLLVFPTRYANEAEPVVVLEALHRGLPVVGWTRGCLADLLQPGLRFDAADAGVITAAADAILRLARDDAAYAQASAWAVARFHTLHTDGQAGLRRLIGILSETDDAP